MRQLQGRGRLSALVLTQLNLTSKNTGEDLTNPDFCARFITSSGREALSTLRRFRKNTINVRPFVKEPSRFFLLLVVRQKVNPFVILAVVALSSWTHIHTGVIIRKSAHTARLRYRSQISRRRDWYCTSTVRPTCATHAGSRGQPTIRPRRTPRGPCCGDL